MSAFCYNLTENIKQSHFEERGIDFMKKRFFMAALALAIAAASLTGTCMHAGRLYTVQAETKAAAKADMQSVQQFGYELLEQYLSEKNPVMSPASAYVMLGMVGNGAKGTTLKEFQKVLGTDMVSAAQSLMEALPQQKDGTTLTIANSAWMDDEFTPKKKWLQTAQKQFQSEVFQENLDTNAVKNKINTWVSDRTNHLIPKLLDKKLDKETRLALVNALYFHADWQQKFHAEGTGEADFHLDNGKVKKVDMMHATIREGAYFKDDASEGVVLPYQDSNYAFVAVKPAKEESIRDWYASYSAEKLAALIDSREEKTVELALPKFEMRCRMTLNDSLKKMGIKRAFDEKKADLSLLGKSQNDENLYLSFVLQEAVISVAEEGTEAAAATIGAIAAGTAFIPDMPVVHFDRSFLYMIMDMESGAPVFMGVVDQP